MSLIKKEQKRGLIYCQTLGCKVNAYESALIQERFMREGFDVASEPFSADIYVINTCTVTAEADRKTRQMIRRARKIAPNAIIAAMGCQIQSDPKNNEADVIVGTQNRQELVKKAIEALENKGTSAIMSDLSFERQSCSYDDGGPVLAQDGVRAYIKIQDGCDRFCSYCIIPYMRGTSRSRPMSSILDEAQALSDNGYKEVVITGINVCAYGKDLNQDEDVSDVARRIAEIKSIERVRMGSLEPVYMNEKMIANLSYIEKMAPHFHLSLQSGSNRILKAMNRHYDTNFFLNVVDQIKMYFPCHSLTTDIIVGFPGETKTDHTESLAFCRQIAFSKIHVFPFSPRKGTRAADLMERPNKETVKMRCDEFKKLSFDLFEKCAKKKTGAVLDVLIEKQDSDGLYSGYSEDYYRVRVRSADSFDVGQIVPVRVQGVDNESLIGIREKD